MFLDYINAFYEIFDHQNMGLDCSSIPARSASVQFLYAFTNLTCVLVYDVMTLCVENNG